MERIIMDPNETLKQIQEALDTNEGPYESCKNLNTWLLEGGFEPNWENYPDATNYFRAHPDDHWWE